MEVGVGIEVRNYDNGNGNPMTMPWEIWDDDNTVIEKTSGLYHTVTPNTATVAELSNSEEFVGIDFGLFAVIGIHIKIVFQLN